MKFQALILISLAYAASAYSYNYQSYYSRPLQAKGYGGYSQPPMATPPPTTTTTTTTPAYKSYESSSSYESYGQQMPMASAPERRLSREENPCSEEVLRSPEIQAFRDPLDRASYIVCTEIDVFVRMPCASGTHFDETIRHCVPEGWVAPVCPVGLCQNQADCIIDEMKNEYKCLCRVGFTGIFCETNIDECALEGNNVCGQQGGRCVDQVNTYYCDFGNKIGCELETAIDRPCTLVELAESKQFYEFPTSKKNMFLQCTGVDRWTVSKCADMLFWNQELRTCTISQPNEKTGVCMTFPCKNDGTCEDLGSNNFQCTCKPGFTGALCEETIDYCVDRPCGSGRCVSHPGGYNCVCQNKVVDQTCDRGYTNPCTGPFEYLTNVKDRSEYFVCAIEGLAFVKRCAPGTFWDDSVKTCIAPEVVAPQIIVNKPPMRSIFDAPQMPMSGYGSNSYASIPKATPPPMVESYESYGSMPKATPPPVVSGY